jgi:arginine decarboxylase-like protein
MPQDSNGSITAQNSSLYNVEGWSEGYVRINDAGHVTMRPQRKEGEEIDLMEIVEFRSC